MYGTGVQVLDIVLLFVCYSSAANQVEVNEWLAISELYSTNNYVNVHILFVVR